MEHDPTFYMLTSVPLFALESLPWIWGSAGRDSEDSEFVHTSWPRLRESLQVRARGDDLVFSEHVRIMYVPGRNGTGLTQPREDSRTAKKGSQLRTRGRGLVQQ